MHRVLIALGVWVFLGACSIQRYAIKSVGDVLASSGSVFGTDDDPVLIGEALPFSLRPIDSLLAEQPDRAEGRPSRHAACGTRRSPSDATLVGEVEGTMTAVEPTVVEVEETRTGRYTQAARSGRHVLTADEPKAVGGDDAGPGPYEYLLIALGSCTSMTLRMYAELKNLPLERVRVRLTHRKIHAKDCADCETIDGKIDEITREITLEGGLTEEQRARLLEIATRCPVNRTLTSQIKVRTRLATE